MAKNFVRKTRLIPRAAAILALAALSGCGRSEAEYQKLLVENQQLKAELEKSSRLGGGKGAGEAGARADAPDLDLAINELLAQRFDDTEFRARNRLADKIIRVTGSVESVLATSVILYGTSKRFGTARLTINLNGPYAGRVKAGLVSLEKGAAVTVQGRFVYDRMWLNDAVFVDKATGRTLFSDELSALVPPPDAAPLPGSDSVKK
jgi:hypothetical protein